MGRETSPRVWTALAAAMKNRVGIVLGQWVALLSAAVVALNFAGDWNEAWTTFFSPFWSHPLALLLGCLFVFLCIRGAKRASHRVAYFGCRIVLLLLSCAAVVTSLRGPLVLATLATGLGSLSTNSDPSEGPGYSVLLFLWGEGAALIGLGAAGIRFVFDWQVRYWLFLLEFVAGLLIILSAWLYPVIIDVVRVIIAKHGP